MKIYFVAYAAVAGVFLLLDLAWLGVVAKTFYRSRIGHLMRADIDLAAATVFYLFYVTGIVIFAVQPALRSGSSATAALWGGLFGLFAYGTYDLTNRATLRDWPVSLVVTDIAWGTVLTAVAATAGAWAVRVVDGS